MKEKEVGKYRVVQTSRSCINIYEGEELIIALFGATLDDFPNEESIEEEIEYQRTVKNEEDYLGNYGEMMAAQHDLMMDAIYA